MSDLMRKWWIVSCCMVGMMCLSFNTVAQDTVRVETYEERREATPPPPPPPTEEVESERSTTIVTSTERERDYDRPSYARGGIKGGVNFSNLVNHAGDDVSGRVGWHLGVYGQLFASETFALQPELMYSTRGNRYRYNNGTTTQQTNFNLSYLDLPVLLVFKLGQAVEIQAGPYWSYLLGVNLDDDSGDWTTRGRRNFNAWDWGLAGGLGFGMGPVQLGARYNYGLQEITRSDDAIRIIGENPRNTFWQIFLSFNFNHRANEDRYYNE